MVWAVGLLFDNKHPQMSYSKILCFPLKHQNLVGPGWGKHKDIHILTWCGRGARRRWRKLRVGAQHWGSTGGSTQPGAGVGIPQWLCICPRVLGSDSKHHAAGTGVCSLWGASQ